MFIADDIVFDNKATYFKVEAGSDAFLDCIATGDPQPEISWRFERQKVEPGNEQCIETLRNDTDFLITVCVAKNKK